MGVGGGPWPGVALPRACAGHLTAFAVAFAVAFAIAVLQSELSSPADVLNVRRSFGQTIVDQGS